MQENKTSAAASSSVEFPYPCGKRVCLCKLAGVRKKRARFAGKKVVENGEIKNALNLHFSMAVETKVFWREIEETHPTWK